MDSLTYRVLLIDDDEDDYIVTRDLLAEAEQSNFDLTWVETYQAGLNALQDETYDAYLVDYLLGGGETGLDFLKAAIALGVSQPIILLTGLGNYQVDQESMTLGAADYLVKGSQLNSPLLERSILHAIERNRANEKINLLTELTKSQQKFQRLVSDIGDKFVIFSHTNPIVSYVSGGFEAVFGVSAETILGQSWETAIQWVPESLKFAQTQTREMLANKANSQEFELSFIHPDNKWRTLHVTQHAVWDELGNLNAIEGVAEDITERKEYEVQLQRTNEELLRATRLKDEFLASMSHELRTPLNAVLGMTEVLEEALLGPITEQQRDALKTIETSGTHLLELINEILDLAKIEAGKMELHSQPTAIAPLCKLSLSFIKQLAHKKNIKVQTHIPENLPQLLVDERRINQALINLLNNAVKFTPDGGTITLEVTYPSPTSTVSTGAETNNTQNPNHCHASTFLQISVIDTGIGIAPENLTKLFRPFIQIDGALNRKYAGTGLGLALVKDIIELHGGEVGVTSEEGVGSCFTINLPCTDCNPASIQSVSLESEKTSSTVVRPPLILLVEDDQANINTVSSYLEAKRYEICLAKNGLEALELVKTKDPDLILMDIQMPQMDGLETTRRLRQIQHLEATPIIALTALAMEGDREKCLAAGATDYMGKPVKLKQLLTKIQQLLTSQ